jgi:putative NADH-flavin reductase
LSSFANTGSGLWLDTPRVLRKRKQMNIVVFGANGQTGQLLTKQAVDLGHRVTAVTRHPEAFPLHHEQVQVLRGDVFDLADVQRAVAGQDAVLSSLGVPYSFKPITLYSQGMAHLVQAMARSGVRRLVCVSSSATDPHETGGGFLLDHILQPLIIATLGRTMYADMKRMETLVSNSQLDWTIVRSNGLFETEAVTDYQLAEEQIRGIFTSRADLANCMLHQLTTDQYMHKIVAIATVEGTPNFFAFFRKEAFKRKAA